MKTKPNNYELTFRRAEKEFLRFDQEEMIRACFEHHERMDGSGYPQHIKDKSISRVARITAVADSFSAMICDRPYAAGDA